MLCDFYRVTGNLDHLLNDEELAVDELQLLVAAGGSAVVDVTPIDAGRDAAGLARISTATGVHIVMGTGWYRQRWYPPEIDTTSTNELCARITRDLVGKDGVIEPLAGVIGEIGFERELPTAAEERVLRAACRAQKLTGAPIFTHASMHPAGRWQLEIIEEEGVDPSRVVVGHADTYLDEQYHLDLVRRGAYVAFDTIAREHMNPDSRRRVAVLRLLEAGWIDRILLSSDRCFRSDLVAFGGVGYAVTFERFFASLRDAGVSDAELDRMSRDNPAAILAW